MAKQMRDKGYLQYLKNLLEEYGIKPENLEIEVTEGILLEKTESNMDFLREVRRLGLRLALDDFGSGYSSLSYLTFLPVNKIKLDKSINDKFLGMENIQVMQRIISLAHSLGLSITAEGIEEEDQFQKLKTCGWIRFRAIFLPGRSRPGRWKKFIIRFLRLMGWMSEASGGFVQQTEKNREKRKFFQLNEKTFFYLPGKLRERQSGIQDCCHQCP